MKKVKKFSRRVMEITLQPLVSVGMYRAILKHTNNYSSYIRELIKKDLLIDDFGNPVKND